MVEVGSVSAQQWQTRDAWAHPRQRLDGWEGGEDERRWVEGRRREEKKGRGIQKKREEREWFEGAGFGMEDVQWWRVSSSGSCRLGHGLACTGPTAQCKWLQVVWIACLAVSKRARGHAYRGHWAGQGRRQARACAGLALREDRVQTPKRA
jgi:hypothetical protein